MTDIAPAPRPHPTRGQGLALASASGLGALSNFVIMFLMTRTLTDAEQQSEALAFWSVLTGLFGVLVGVQNESTRATAAVRHGRPERGRLLSPVLGVGLAAALLVSVAAAVGIRWVLPSHPLWATTLLVATALCYAVYALVLGAMAGTGRWAGLAGTLTAEVAVRVIAVAGVALTVRSLFGYQTAMTSAVVVMTAALCAIPATRALLTSRSDREARVSLRQLGMAILSAASSAVMITGYPALMKASLRGEPQLAAWMLAVSITRAPVMMPIITFQQVAVARFVAHRRGTLRAMVVPVALVLAVGAVAAVGAGLLGPWFLRLFDPSFDIGGWALALLTLASTAMAALVLVGTAALALDGHRVYGIGWALAAVTSITVLFTVPLPVLPRLLASLVAGPVVGAVILLGWLLVQSRRTSPNTE
ncbi:hypothetical protein [Aestuariimicrobium sp. T2.26MG-19.2B]|uniref:hypothetical protein n=1 Tax=Aestuariimicrobium sp. T2.26MG-19.2B TaxID=3040679 RepID=UPI002477B17B|nr:hypothetical protein [Aestuariimicrobium sp. T2.26MG-19.2B]CAI9410966.1 putative protein [Aestuariimicrobium sp. T2.26MG-19.2B]